MGRMGRPRADAHAVATLDRIVDAAEAEFAARGRAGARLEDIAAVAGIRRPSLLYHFGSKERLHAEVVRRAFSRLAAALAAPLAEAPEARATRVIDAFVAFVEGDRWFAPLLLRELLDGGAGGRDMLLEEVAPVLDGVERALNRPGVAYARGALLDLAAASLVRSVAGPLRERLWGPPEPADRLARRLHPGA